MSKKEQIEKSLAKSIAEFKMDNPGVKYVQYEDLYYTENEVDYYVLPYNQWGGSNSYEARICHEYLKKNHNIVRNEGKITELLFNRNIIELN